MSRPFREYLEIVSRESGEWISCSRCRHALCPLGGDWKLYCKVNISPPVEAGPFFDDLTGRFLLQRTYCPSCGVLYDTALVPNRSSPSSPEESHG
jgi:hypothetical protein